MGSHRPRRTRCDPDAEATAATAPAGRVTRLARRLYGLPVALRTVALAVVVVLTVVAAMHGASSASGHSTSVATPADDPGAPGASTGSGGTTGSPAADPTTAAPLPPAPAGFADSVDTLYQKMNETAVKSGVPSTPQLAPTTQFDGDVAALTPDQLAQFYAVTQQVSGWDQLDSTYSQTLTEAPAMVAAAGGTAAVAVATEAARARIADGTFTTTTTATSGKQARALPAPAQVSPSALENYEPPQTPATLSPADCPAGAPGADEGEDSLFATQLAIDAFTIATSDTPQLIVTAFGNATIPDPVNIVLGVLLFVAQVIHDTFDYLQSVAGDCGGDTDSAYLVNIDTNTFESYTLLNEVGQTADEIDSNLTALQNQTTANEQQELILEIEAALAAPQGSVPVVAFELPASKGGFLDRSPVGVESIVTDALTTMEAAGQAVNPLASRELVQADQALGANEYKQAWALFRTTYAYVAS